MSTGGPADFDVRHKTDIAVVYDIPAVQSGSAVVAALCTAGR